MSAQNFMPLFAFGLAAVADWSSGHELGTNVVESQVRNLILLKILSAEGLMHVKLVETYSKFSRWCSGSEVRKERCQLRCCLRHLNGHLNPSSPRVASESDEN
ncbi:hypothetical protein TNCV_3755751 [Trichonephila clavipes]|nr:hypothetical protein TNCV_3755751 [Trichonephila clavipes]